MHCRVSEDFGPGTCCCRTYREKGAVEPFGDAGADAVRAKPRLRRGRGRQDAGRLASSLRASAIHSR